ncbi:hypothetical protein IWX47DRAFT_862213 [Phyllosticta citricarpa]
MASEAILQVLLTFPACGPSIQLDRSLPRQGAILRIYNRLMATQSIISSWRHRTTSVRRSFLAIMAVRPFRCFFCSWATCRSVSASGVGRQCPAGSIACRTHRSRSLHDHLAAPVERGPVVVFFHA